MRERCGEEFCSYLPIAVEEYKNTPDTFLAWAAALKRRPRGKPLHGASLVQLVKRLGGWGASTTVCERLLSKFVRVVNKQRDKDASEYRIHDEAGITRLSDLPNLIDSFILTIVLRLLFASLFCIMLAEIL